MKLEWSHTCSPLLNGRTQSFRGCEGKSGRGETNAERQNKTNQAFLSFRSKEVLVRSDSEMLSSPNSPLLVLLQLVDPNVLSGGEDAPLQEGATRVTPLTHLADLADPLDYSTHENQLVLAK
jgi:hypothetical protein